MLGPLSVRDGGDAFALGGLRQRTVLAALLIAGGRAVTVDALIDQVWGTDPPPKPVASLRSYLTNLRRIVGDKALDRTAHGYVLNTEADVVDAREFARLVSQGRSQLRAGRPAAARADLADGLALWRGEPFGEFRHLEFVTPEVHRLEALRVDGLEAFFDAALRLGESSSLVDEIESELAVNPLRETLWGSLMVALYRSGRRTDALRAFERARTILDEELGVGPGVELGRLAGEIRRESPTLEWRPPSAPEERQVAVTGASVELHGRSAEIRRLHSTLTAAVHGRGGVMVIRGDSGMGKTALAQRVVDMARDAGMATAWAGHAADLHRPPSWAWAHAVRGIAGHGRLSGNHSHTPLPDWWGGAVESSTGDDDGRGREFAAIEATAAALGDLVAARPGLIVLDDLQRADRFTRRVLEHLTSAARCMPMLVVATWQDGGADGVDSAREFDRFADRTDVDVLRLTGLDAVALTRLIADIAGVQPCPEFVDGMLDRTGGNPFYVTELVRFLVDNGRVGELDLPLGDDADVPEAVSGVIRRRMADLPEATRSLLRVAAVAGTEFPVSRLAAVAGSSIAEAAEVLAPAQTAGLIATTAQRHDAFRFGHGLVRDAVAAVTTGADRAGLHAAIARTYAADDGATVSQDAIDGAEHAWNAGHALDPDTALLLIDRARADAWSRCAYREVAELDRRALETCARLPADSGRFDREVDLRLQLASVEAVVSGQSSAHVLADLRFSARAGNDAVEQTTAVAMGCLEACGMGRYRDAATLSDGLVEFFAVTGNAIAGAAGYYMRALAQFMGGAMDLALASVREMRRTVPPVDWRTYGALASFEVLAHGVAAHAHAMRAEADSARTALSDGFALAHERGDAFGVAVLRTADIQLSAMVGETAGLAQRAADVVTLLQELGIEQFVGGARLIHGWARAVGPDAVDTVDDMHAALNLHAQGGRRIFSPLYYGLLSDATALHRGPAEAVSCINHAEATAAATGERVWDAQLSARRLRLAAARMYAPQTDLRDEPSPASAGDADQFLVDELVHAESAELATEP